MDGGRLSTHEPLRNSSLVGGCYDILYVDPLDISLRAAHFPGAFMAGDFEDLPDQPASKPVSLEYRPAFGGGSDKVVSELSSSTDFQTLVKTQGSLGVADPTGKLFCATLSSSFEHLSQETSNRSRVLTYVSERVSRFRLAVTDDTSLLFLTPEIEAAFRALPAVEGPEHDRFIHRFGTHYLSSALYGGRATQRLSVSTEDYA